MSGGCRVGRWSQSSEWDSFASGSNGWVKEWRWLKEGWRVARVARQNLDLRPILLDVPERSLDEGGLVNADGLEDGATCQPHRHLLVKVEWVWLKVGSPSLDMAFIDPPLALGALGKGQWGIDERFAHLGVNLDPFPFPS